MAGNKKCALISLAIISFSLFLANVSQLQLHTSHVAADMPCAPDTTLRMQQGDPAGDTLRVQQGEPAGATLRVQQGDPAGATLKVQQGDPAGATLKVQQGDPAGDTLRVQQGEPAGATLRVQQGDPAGATLRVQQGDPAGATLRVQQGDPAGDTPSVQQGDPAGDTLRVQQGDPAVRNSSHYPAVRSHQVPAYLQEENVLRLGHRRNSTTFITIGIASVFRKERYLYNTLQSLIDKSTAEERQNTTVVLMLADRNQPNNTRTTLQQLARQFSRQLASGFLQVITPPDHIYPNLDFSHGRRTYNDPASRVAWRTKQVIDFAFLFTYCNNMSDYYMVLEDDLVAADRYLTAVRDLINANRGKDWVRLTTTNFMIIGNILQTRYLDRLVKLMNLFRSEQPVDYIMNHFGSMMVNAPGVLEKRNPPLFNHVGRSSTLADKVQKLSERNFYQEPRRWLREGRQNPPAQLATSLTVKDSYQLHNAYSAAPGYFWGIGKKSQPNVTIDVLLERVSDVTRVGVVSGYRQSSSKGARLGVLTNGEVLAAGRRLTATGCGPWQLLGRLNSSGALDLSDVHRRMPGGVHCIRVQTRVKPGASVAINEIAVFFDD